MKTAEDEAFEDIERRQGGGFKAKQAMAADKQEPWDWAAHEYDGVHRKAQPAQEPVATIDSLEQEIYENTREFVSLNVMEWLLNRLSTTPPKRKWVGLTDEDRKAVLLTAYKEWECEEFLLCAREDYLLIEQALKEKNG